MRGSDERGEKAKSSQFDGRRRGSRPLEQDMGRPRLKSRTNSAPLEAPARLGAQREDGSGERQTMHAGSKGTGEAIGEDAQDSDEEAGVVGAVKEVLPFRSPEVRLFLLVWSGLVTEEGVGACGGGMCSPALQHGMCLQHCRRDVSPALQHWRTTFVTYFWEDVTLHDGR